MRNGCKIPLRDHQYRSRLQVAPKQLTVSTTTETTTTTHRTKKDLAHLQQLKGYLAFTDFIKNQLIGVAQTVLGTLVWIFEYLTNWLFCGLSGADFWHFLTYWKVANFLEWWVFGILTHKLLWRCQSMSFSTGKIQNFFPLVSLQAMAIWVIGHFWAET